MRLLYSLLLFTSVVCTADTVVGPSPATLQSPTPEGSGAGRYVLAAGDEIEIRLTYNSEFNERVQIRPDGFVSLPLLGEVLLAGRTIGSLSQELRERYATHLKQPELTIQVRSFANQKIFVGGEVGRPGIQLLVNAKTALEAIVEAGGMLRDSARKGTVTVIRRDAQGKPARIQVPMQAKAPNDVWASSFQLQPLDVVIVAESGISKTNRGVDQYVRRMIPVLLTGGFTYLFGPSTGFSGR